MPHSQYVDRVLDWSSQYGADETISYVALNIRGKPSRYPHYGDAADVYVMRSYGPWWKKRSKFGYHTNRNNTFIPSTDFIDIGFSVSVYPQEVRVYETYNPGAVVRISALVEPDCVWRLLWEGQSGGTQQAANIFSPNINKIHSKTNILRLEFNSSRLQYYTEIDAVQLVGRTDSCNLLQQLETLHLLDVPCGIDVCEIFNHFLNNHYVSMCQPVEDLVSDVIVNDAELVNDVDDDADSGSRHLTDFSYEILHRILSYLDLLSLCRVACVSSQLSLACSDPHLYRTLNLKDFWSSITPTALTTLYTKCGYIKALDVSWCGGYNQLKPAHAIQFLECCSKSLCSFRGNNCPIINTQVLETICDKCTNITELSLDGCGILDNSALLCINSLSKLRVLSLYRTNINIATLTYILSQTPHVISLNIGGCVSCSPLDDVVAAVARYCTNIEHLDFWKVKGLTAVGVGSLAQCTRLTDLDIGWNSTLNCGGGCIVSLVQQCTHLEKLFLTAVRSIGDGELVAIAENLTNIAQLDVLGTRNISPHAVYWLLGRCASLELLDVSFCAQLTMDHVDAMRREFPHVHIKRSQTTNSNLQIQGL